MSSSCVPPKSSCVVHNPDPDGPEDDRGNDTDSECGSLCTCSSGSMTSIATSVSTSNPHHSRRLAGSSASLSQSLPHQHRPSSGNASETNGNPYFVVFVPPALVPGRRRNCGNCPCFGTLGKVLRAYILTACEFCPWVAGFVLIYYAFYWWGIGPGFTAFLFMMGSHALLRFLKARGEPDCTLRRLQESRNAEEENDDDNDGNNNDEGSSEEPPEEVVNESPPSYESAVGKPPPYDLFHHLTPTQPRSSPTQEVKKQNINNNILTVPTDYPLRKEPRDSIDLAEEDDDVFLPSYQDALRLSFRSEKESPPSPDNREES
ncbi:hypothetical protein SK128_006495 [Halocaridina rubra]|uniref:Uncharacterized protein n=1 Tax=Halocaridina rubra TaxID=373956 RepID=A0AAN9AHM0_HALRR